MAFLTNIWLLIVTKLLIGGLMFFSGIIKMFDLKGFSRITMAYGVFPRLTSRLAYVLPFVEAIAGIGILMGLQLYWSALLALLLQLVATAMVFLALLRRKKMENCGCYGVAIKVPLSWKKVWLNLLFIAITIILLAAAGASMSSSESSSAVFDVLDVLT